MNRKNLVKILALAGLMLAIYNFWGLARSGITTSAQTDFTTYYEIPEMVFENHVDSPYANFSPLYPYFYPPASLLIFYPLTLLSYPLARAIWAIVSLTALVGGVVLAMRVARVETKIEHLGIIFLAISFFYPLHFTLIEGQINTILFFLLAAALHFFRRGKDIPSAFCLALGTIIKISPLILLFYFLWRRKYKIFLWGIFFIFLFSLAVEVFVKHGINFYYLRYVVDDISKQGGVGLQDQSLNWFLLKFKTVPKLFHLAEKFFRTPLLTYQRFVLSLNYTVVGAIFVFLSWISRCPIENRKDELIPLEYSLFLIPALLGTGLAWFHQYVLLLLPFVVGYGLALRLENRFEKTAASLSLGVSFSLMTTGVGGRILYLKNVFGFASPVFLYAAALLWLALLFLRFRKNHRPR